MLEIIFLSWLCKRNGLNALDRGASPFKYKALTVLLWFGLEILGFALGVALGFGTSATTYVLSLILAGCGGFISNVISKNAQ